MTEPEESERKFIYSFGADQEPSSELLRGLARYGIARGLTPLFTFTETPSADAEVEDHYRETYPPRSRSDYMGKEHFWKLGVEAGLDRRVSGFIFFALLYPMKRSELYGRASEIMRPEDLGLHPVFRKDVKMPRPPKGLGLLNQQSVNSDHHRWSRDGNKIPPYLIVVQAGELLTVCQADTTPQIVEGFSTPRKKENLSLFGARLATLIN